MKTITRRALARIASAAAVSALSAQQSQTAEYIGPLTGVDNKVADRGLDPLPQALRLLDSAPRRLRFSARTKAQAQQWQGQLRPKLVELLGGFPAEPVPLRPVTVETRQYARYRREKVVFDTRDGVSVLAYILTPLNARSPVPAVVCVPGHGRGVDDIVGIDEKAGNAPIRTAISTTLQFRSQRPVWPPLRSSRSGLDVDETQRTRSADLGVPLVSR